MLSHSFVYIRNVKSRQMSPFTELSAVVISAFRLDFVLPTQRDRGGNDRLLSKSQYTVSATIIKNCLHLPRDVRYWARYNIIAILF